MKKLLLYAVALMLSFFGGNSLKAEAVAPVNNGVEFVMIIKGENPSILSRKVCGNASFARKIMADNKITDDRHIFAGTILRISCAFTSVENTSVPEKEPVSLAFASLTNRAPVAPIDIEAPSLTPELATDLNATTTLALPKSPMPPISAQAPITVSGYRLIIPAQFAGGIVLKQELPTCIVPARGRRDCKVRSWASQQKNGDVALQVFAPQLPDKQFNLLIAGVPDPIDGPAFIARASPFEGRFPGPGKLKKALIGGGQIGLSIFTMTRVTGNPYAGIGLGVGIPAARWVVHSIVNARMKRNFRKQQMQREQQMEKISLKAKEIGQ